MLAWLPVHDPGLDQTAKPVRQNIAGDAERFEKMLEMDDAIETGAQDHERPPVTHHLQRAREAAFAQMIKQLLHPEGS
jgi:hypothetical protein